MERKEVEVFFMGGGEREVVGRERGVWERVSGIGEGGRVVVGRGRGREGEGRRE